MRALIQRVSKASVLVDSVVTAQINAGLLVFVGIKKGDTQKEIDYITDKIANLRIFEGETGKFDFSAIELKKEILVVSQFTLYADCSRGRRPDFGEAAPTEEAKEIYEKTVEAFKKTGLKVSTGQFQAHMAISLVNDGPVTIMLNSK
jgi:D-aminoacyl-tRNA deacylase